MELILGNFFSIPLDENGCMRRKLIYRNKRAVGHISSGNYHDKHYLWLQNYAGYYSPIFVLTFDTEEAAMNRAAQILEDWDTNPERPTWCY